ncbi:MAG: sulfur carrier protein ThiS [Myxococcota bacterium]
MRVVVNGEPREVPAGATVRELLTELGLGDQLVAVERNLDIVPRAEHAHTRLAEGDDVEVVHFVGGG